MRYQSTVSSRIRTTWSPVMTARECQRRRGLRRVRILRVAPRCEGHGKTERCDSLQHRGGGLWVSANGTPLEALTGTEVRGAKCRDAARLAVQWHPSPQGPEQGKSGNEQQRSEVERAAPSTAGTLARGNRDRARHGRRSVTGAIHDGVRNRVACRLPQY